MEQQNLTATSTTEGDELARLERQVERGSLFTHTVVSRNAESIQEGESILYGLIDILIEKGIVSKDDILNASGKVRQEMDEKGQNIGPGIALHVSAENKKDVFVPVNCLERLHVCKAVCCKLHFALTAEQVESGKIKWDLGQPYYIRHEVSGYCSHSDPATRCCSVYEHRPGICHQYSCANDTRIWSDFANLVLNEEWISEHLVDTRPHLTTTQMVPQQLLFQQKKDSTT